MIGSLIRVAVSVSFGFVAIRVLPYREVWLWRKCLPYREGGIEPVPRGTVTHTVRSEGQMPRGD